MTSSPQQNPPALRQYTLKVGWRSALTNSPQEQAPNTETNEKQEPAPASAELTPIKKACNTHSHVSPKKTRRKLNGVFISVTSVIIIMLLLAITPLLFPAHKPSAVATIMLAQGDFYRNKHPSHSSATLFQGDTFSTAKNSQVNLLLNTTTAITLDENTTLTLLNNGIQLHSGRAYIDASVQNASVTIVTPFGEITDIGTQYEVRVTTDTLHIIMREGTTKITTPSQVIYASTSADLGDSLTLDHAGNTQTQHIAKSDEHWQWILNTEADFNLYNASPDELLQWASRITGKEVIYASQALEQQAKQRHFTGGGISSKNISLELPKILLNTGLIIEEHRRAFMVGGQLDY